MNKEEIKQKKDWEKEFDKKFVDFMSGEGVYFMPKIRKETNSKDIKDFISNLLTLQKKELLKHIEKRKKVLNELLSKYNLEVDKHRIRELNLLEESLKKQLN